MSAALADLAASGRQTWRAWLACAVCVLLTACASVPKPAAGPGDAQAFTRNGRFAITIIEVTGEQRAVQGGFAWRDDGHRYTLDLTNPLGSTEARVEGGPGFATLTRSDGTQLQAAGPDSLAEEALGGPVPVAGLRDWLRGRVSSQADSASITRDELGRPAVFQQGGWRARLSRYDAQGPGLLVLERREPGRRIVVRLAIDSA